MSKEIQFNPNTYANQLLDDKSLKINCPINVALQLISKKWVLQIICALDKSEPLRFGQLKQRIPNISDIMLSKILKELQGYNLVGRKQYEEIPPRVEYFLTDDGKDILPAFNHVAKWGLDIMGSQNLSCNCTEKCYVMQHKYLPPKDVHKTEQYPHKWDIQYEEAGRELQTQKMKDLSSVERIKWFARSMLRILTTGDYDHNSLVLVYLNGVPDPELTNHNRPHYRIISSLIDEGKRNGEIREDLDSMKRASLISLTAWSFNI